ncbi:NACHT, LRR and PYD domains-containing protein 12-like [Anneissia japonica]|uniref:NACHT, LRR and PYD domains-containing protein 12-like n=1 Tax=Anneissia japonica TaxID=1529436 RepID=UPI0014258E3C|nr:NACHT, LRR and PYD domains-containing protein 12-like [Anneissia japonica]
MTVMQFNVLKMIVSDWYNENRCLTMLKVLFRDTVDIGKLAEITDTIDLLNELVKLGKMSAKDLTLLYDTIRITGHFSLQIKIKETFPLFPDIEEGIISTSFTPHRQKLLKLGKKLTLENVTRIDKLYNTPRKMYTDSWSMIIDLEDRLEISEENMTTFIKSLKLLKLHLALQVLTEVDNGEVSTSETPKSDKGYCGPADGMGESAMSSHQQQPPPARQLLLPQQLQQLQAQDAYNYLVWNQPIPDSSRSAVQGNRPMEGLRRPLPGYCGPADGIGKSAMSSHQQQTPPARQLLLPQQLQQLQAQILVYNYLAWNQPIPDWLRSAVQDNRLVQSLQRPSPDKIIKDYLTRQQKKWYQDVNRMTPAIWHKHYKVDIAEIFTELSLRKSKNNSSCTREKGEPTSLTEVLNIIESEGSCKVLITGKAGMGKTTLLKYITYKWATGDVHNAFAGKLLFLIKIGDIKAGADIVEIIMKNVNTNELLIKNNLPIKAVERFLYNHGDDIVILLDGYDELQSDAKDLINLFKGVELEKSTVVITSRPDNTENLVECCTLHIQVNGFSSRNIKEYINKYFCSTKKYELGKSLLKEFSFHLEDEWEWDGNHNVAFGLCSSPLLLLMICTIWEQKQHFPKDLSDLFTKLICCILSQYESKCNKPDIFPIERIPEQYKLAILLLGECMYEGLKENKLSIDKYVLSKMSKNLHSVELALKLGFVYEDTPFNPGDVREIYTPPHKLISEALAGFYLANQIEKEHLKGDEYEVIRCNKYLNMTRKFTIGFLDDKAGEMLKHWLVMPSQLYSVAQCFNYVKEENEKSVLRKLDENMSTKMKSYCEQMCETFRSVLDDDRSEHLLKLIKKCCVKYKNSLYKLEQKVVSLVDTSSKESLRKSCRRIVLTSVIEQITNDSEAGTQFAVFVLRCISNWKDESLNVLSAEIKYLQINYDCPSLTLHWGFNSSFLIHFLTHSNLSDLFVHDGLLTEDTLSVVIKELHKTNVKLTLKLLSISCTDLRNIDGALLGKLFEIGPALNRLNASNCRLSSDIVRAMITECSNNGCKQLCHLDISNNDLDDALLCDILKMYPALSILKVASCGLSKESLNNMVNEFPEIKLLELDFSRNCLGNLDGETFGTLMKKLPKLRFFGMAHCSISGSIVNEMMKECSTMNVVLKDNMLELDGNDLSDINGKSIAELVRVVHRYFSLHDYFLTADNLQQLFESVDINIKLNWKYLYMSKINLSCISGKTLSCLFNVSPDLIYIDLSNCSLSGSIVNEMMEECGRMNVVLKGKILRLEGNYLSDINGESLAEVMVNYLDRVITMHQKCLFYRPGVGSFIWRDYRLTADNLHKLVESVGENKTLSSNIVDVNLNRINLSSISGKTLACFLKIFPDISHIDMSHCSLSGSIVNEMKEECVRLNVVLKENVLKLKGNDLSDVDAISY